MKKKLILLLFMSALSISGGIVVYYYWSSSVLDEIRRVPMQIMIASLIYVLLQIAKRAIIKENNWWDWLYYIGLLSIMIPTFFATETNVSAMHFLTDYGSLFLLIPMLFDIKILLKPSE